MCQASYDQSLVVLVHQGRMQHCDSLHAPLATLSATIMALSQSRQANSDFERPKDATRIRSYFCFHFSLPTGSTRSTAKLHYSTTGAPTNAAPVPHVPSPACSVARLPCLMPALADSLALHSYEFCPCLHTRHPAFDCPLFIDCSAVTWTPLARILTSEEPNTHGN